MFIIFFLYVGRYPVPQCRVTQGRSEEYLGRWIKDEKIPRDRVVLATKVTFKPQLYFQLIVWLLTSTGTD
jgi:hypothetical protein